MLRRIARRSCPLLPTGPEVQGVWQVDVCIGGTEEAGTASPPANDTFKKCRLNFGPASQTVSQHQADIVSMSRVCTSPILIQITHFNFIQ